MSIIRYKQNEIEYCITTGRLINTKLTKTDDNARTSFMIAYQYSRDDFDNLVSDNINCIAWGNLAEFIKSIPYKIQVMVVGKIHTYIWENEEKEQLVCDFIIPQPNIKRKRNKSNGLDDLPI